MDVLVGTDFFTVDVLTLRGLVTCYVLFFIHLQRRRGGLFRTDALPRPGVDGAANPQREHEGLGFLAQSRYLLHDGVGKFCPWFREVIGAGQVRTLQLPACGPNLNAYAESWVRSVKQECTARLILFGESSPRRALTQYTEHHHGERSHQGKGSEVLFPIPWRPAKKRGAATIQCKEHWVVC